MTQLEKIESKPISRKELAKLLNEDLAREYQAIIAYVVYSQTARCALFDDGADSLVKHRNLLSQAPPGHQHRTDDRSDIRMIDKQSIDASIERDAAHVTWQKTERLQHTSDVVRQTRRHTDKL